MAVWRSLLKVVDGGYLGVDQDVQVAEKVVQVACSLRTNLPFLFGEDGGFIWNFRGLVCISVGIDIVVVECGAWTAWPVCG